MAAGDIETYGPMPTNVVDSTLTGNGIVVADDITMTNIGHLVFVLVVKAA